MNIIHSLQVQAVYVRKIINKIIAKFGLLQVAVALGRMSAF